MTSGPLIVQSDKTALLEVDHPQAADARHDLAIFAELERAPEHIHTYRITRLGLWNARAAGHDSDFVLGILDKYAKFAIPGSVRSDITETMSRYGRLVIQRSPDCELELFSKDRAILLEASRHRKIVELLDGPISNEAFRIQPWARGQVKQELLKLGWPAEDFAGYTEGTPHEISMQQGDWKVRDYQNQAVEKFWAGGSGVVVLPCGAGKTIVGAAAMAVAKTNTLILVTNTVSARQWKTELMRRTTLTEDEIGEYSGSLKEIKPVTIATYQILTTKRKSDYAHLALLNANDWGLIVYDEVHLLPAPIFKMTADLQARRRLGLTATLVREDGKEGDVFSLIGPKRFDAPWKEIEAQGYIAPAACFEVRIDLPEEERLNYAIASQEDRYRISATSGSKIPVIKALLAKHPGEPTLIIGSRQEEAQRLGRLLRPKADGRSANFYTLIARDTIDQDFAQNRQRFLAEQGYSYEIIDADAL